MRIVSCFIIVLCVLVLQAASLSLAATLRPVSCSQFFVDPGTVATLRFTVVDGDDIPKPLRFSVIDAAGRGVYDLAGIAERADGDADGVVSVKLPLGQGFWEVDFEGTKQCFGVLVMPRVEKPWDTFFAIDAALSWLVPEDNIREDLIDVSARFGIGMLRERFDLRNVNPTRGEFDFNTKNRYDKVREAYRRKGIEILEVFHQTPPWMGKVKVYPDNLVEVAKSWPQIAARWDSTWGALEIWNEPDIFFGGDLPADQYVPLAQTVAYALKSSGTLTKPLVTGVLAHFNEEWLHTAAECGFLDDADVLSFHTYWNAPDVYQQYAWFRNWLVRNGHPKMPLWLTECGCAWSFGTERPTAEQDLNSACAITMKGIEARCYGVTRYFPFVLPYYEERENNFGMVDRTGSPMRALAAYVQSVRVLSHTDYLGDLVLTEPEVVRSRVFARDDDNNGEAVLVLYTGKAEQETRVKLPLPPKRGESLTGQIIEIGDSNEVGITSGLAYFWFDRDALEPLLNKDTEAMSIYVLGRDVEVKPRSLSAPIVARYQYDTAVVNPVPAGYQLLNRLAVGGSLPIVVRLFNLSDDEKVCQVTSYIAGSDAASQVSAEVTVPLQSHTDYSFTLPCRPDEPQQTSVVVKVAHNGTVVRELVLQFHNKPAESQ